MQIKIIMQGKTADKYINEGVSVYINRLKHYIKADWVELPSKKLANPVMEKVLEQEAEVVTKLIGKNDFVVLLDESGKGYSSTQFAGWVEKQTITNTNDLIFLIGGAYGFHQSLYDRANAKIALSQMTFTHQMVRLIFAEQLYRAFTIIRNEKYHH